MMKKSVLVLVLISNGSCEFLKGNSNSRLLDEEQRSGKVKALIENFEKGQSSIPQKKVTSQEKISFPDVKKVKKRFEVEKPASEKEFIKPEIQATDDPLVDLEDEVDDLSMMVSLDQKELDTIQDVVDSFKDINNVLEEATLTTIITKVKKKNKLDPAVERGDRTAVRQLFDSLQFDLLQNVNSVPALVNAVAMQIGTVLYDIWTKMVYSQLFGYNEERIKLGSALQMLIKSAQETIMAQKNYIDSIKAELVQFNDILPFNAEDPNINIATHLNALRKAIPTLGTN